LGYQVLPAAARFIKFVYRDRWDVDTYDIGTSARLLA